MKPKTVVQVAGLAAIVSIAVVLAFDGVNTEVSFLLLLSVLGIAAPRAFEELVDRFGGGG